MGYQTRFNLRFESVFNVKISIAKVAQLDVVPVARLEGFRALKLYRLEYFRAQSTGTI